MKPLKMKQLLELFHAWETYRFHSFLLVWFECHSSALLISLYGTLSEEHLWPPPEWAKMRGANKLHRCGISSDDF